MSVSDVIRNIAKTVTDKEKAKEVSLLVVQGTLSAAGQALLLVDRMKSSIKGLAGRNGKEEDYDSRPSAADQVSAPADDKPARKEPVIFAPRPAETSEAAEPNGTAKTKPEPVIVAPAAKPAAQPAEPAQAAAVTTEPAVAEPVAAEPTVAEKPAEQEPETKTPEPVAETKVPEPVAEQEPETKAPEPVAETKTSEPVAETKASEPEVEPVGEPAAAAVPAEPLPGYSGLTVASLRARMRGKSAQQISELLAYERATTARPEVIRMFENRLAKLQAGE
jgi:hypothetical protein